MRHLIFALRPKQWIKNVFILMPLIFGRKLFIYPDNARTAAAFVLFCMAASATYLFNDLVDLPHDRLHRAKRLRPLASGRLGVPAAVAACAVLALASLAGAFALDGRFGAIVLLYVFANLFYSRYFKYVVIIDVFCLAFFFTLRILAGTAVADVSFSHWMIFSIVLLALFLGFAKRRQELRNERHAHGDTRAVLEKYSLYFIDQMISVLTSSIVVVYMLYTIDARTVGEVGSNHLIYSIPFVYYGIFRYLYLIHKRNFGEDPTSVVYTDRMLQLNIILWIAACIGVIYYKL